MNPATGEIRISIFKDVIIAFKTTFLIAYQNIVLPFDVFEKQRTITCTCITMKMKRRTKIYFLILNGIHPYKKQAWPDIESVLNSIEELFF